jgi:hypothetical protein
MPVEGDISYHAAQPAKSPYKVTSAGRTHFSFRSSRGINPFLGYGKVGDCVENWRCLSSGSYVVFSNACDADTISLRLIVS